jgi:GNAT superfamily N-acetyltransferase
MEWKRGEYLLSDDKSLLHVETVFQLLRETYWAADRPLERVKTSIEHSFCMGLYLGEEQIGFCRAVTDYATFTWICDVIIAPAHQKSGLGKWMVEQLLEHPLLQTRRQVLATKDAHTLYERFGFERVEFMRRNTKT